jgi:SAM-dependent methyltransferase
MPETVKPSGLPPDLSPYCAPPTASVWQTTRTFFPLFVEHLQQTRARSVCVVGASDGKFVLPLARRGLTVRAIECDALALNGGSVTLPGPIVGTMAGLRQRLAVEGLSDRVEIIQADLLDLGGIDLNPLDAAWTSCSWHYSANHRRPLADFLAAMQALCRPDGGLFGAEYMQPVHPRHLGSEHYPEAGELRRYFADWNILWETYTPAFVEEPHVEQLESHVHRMGLFIADRQPNEKG